MSERIEDKEKSDRVGKRQGKNYYEDKERGERKEGRVKEKWKGERIEDNREEKRKKERKAQRKEGIKLYEIKTREELTFTSIIFPSLPVFYFLPFPLLSFPSLSFLFFLVIHSFPFSSLISPFILFPSLYFPLTSLSFPSFIPFSSLPSLPAPSSFQIVRAGFLGVRIPSSHPTQPCTGPNKSISYPGIKYLSSAIIRRYLRACHVVLLTLEGYCVIVGIAEGVSHGQGRDRWLGDGPAPSRLYPPP